MSVVNHHNPTATVLAQMPLQGQVDIDGPEQDKALKQRLNKLQKRLRRDMGKAIDDYAMIEAGDKVMVCLSGGKDSYTMLDILLNLQKSAPVKFDLVAVNLDQKQPDFPEHILPEYLASLGGA